MVDSDSIHVCTLKKETTKEETSHLYSLSLSPSSSLLIKLFYYLFGWPNLCGVANAEQWDKKNNRYLWLLYGISGRQ